MPPTQDSLALKSRRAMELVAGRRASPHAAERAAPPLLAPRPESRAAAECEHCGAELAGGERQARGLGHSQRWALCLHPEQPLGEAVCPCRGCGPKCPGYES